MSRYIYDTRKMMNNKTYNLLEFDKIREMLADKAIFEINKLKLSCLEPYLNEGEVIRHLNDTTEGKLIIESCGTPPLSSADEMKNILDDINMDAMLSIEQLNQVKSFLVASRRLKSYLGKGKTGSKIGAYEASIFNLLELEDEIARCIRGNSIDDRATNDLFRYRTKIEDTAEEIKIKLNLLLQKNHEYFSDHYIVSRNNHFTLPVQRKYKDSVKGTVVDISNSGNTLFVEPLSIGKLQEELNILKMDEENEVIKILYTLTALVSNYEREILMNIEAMAILDFIFAKAKLSIAMEAKAAKVTIERRIEIQKGRHPLINKEEAVPLDFIIGNNVNGETISSVVITGPNTGGKTVVLKTVGLLSLMTQCGLHVPLEEGIFTMNSSIMCDIGDGQSISENLSTFSSHLTNIISILNTVNNECLVLLDELGSGTDPAEGMGLAVAILEALSKKNCLLLATTHYPEVKEFSSSQKGFINAKMAFDKESLLPLYKLEIGTAGESCALYIAKKLGLNINLIKRAHVVAYSNDNQLMKSNNSDEVLSGILGDDIQRMSENYNDEPTIKDKESLPKIIPKSQVATDDSIKLVEPSKRFNVGDSVIVFPDEEIGIIYQPADDVGIVIVQVKGVKYKVNHKRLKLKIKAEELYPEDYDFSIIFDSVEKRKKERIMSKRHVEDLIIVLDD